PPIEQFVVNNSNQRGYLAIIYSYTPPYGGRLDLGLASTSLIGYQGCQLCENLFAQTTCIDLTDGLTLSGFSATDQINYSLTGSLVPAAVAATPEPSTWALVASGLVCVARRRHRFFPRR